VFPPQRWLRESGTVLRYTYVAAKLPHSVPTGVSQGHNKISKTFTISYLAAYFSYGISKSSPVT
jgi:hypothetical protein